MTNVIQIFCCIFLQTQKSQQPTQLKKAWKLLRKNRRKSSSLLNLRQKLHQLLITPNWTGSWTQQVLHLVQTSGMIYDLWHKKQKNWFKTLVSIALCQWDVLEPTNLFHVTKLDCIKCSFANFVFLSSVLKTEKFWMHKISIFVKFVLKKASKWLCETSCHALKQISS